MFLCFFKNISWDSLRNMFRNNSTILVWYFSFCFIFIKGISAEGSQVIFIQKFVQWFLQEFLQYFFLFLQVSKFTPRIFVWHFSDMFFKKFLYQLDVLLFYHVLIQRFHKKLPSDISSVVPARTPPLFFPKYPWRSIWFLCCDSYVYSTYSNQTPNSCRVSFKITFGIIAEIVSFYLIIRSWTG